MGMNNKQNESGTKRESLPSRAEYHRSKSKRTHKSKAKISIPLVLLLLLLLLPVAILSFIHIGDKPNADRVDSSSGEEVLFETDETNPPKENENNEKEKEPEQEKEKEGNVAHQKESSSNKQEQRHLPKEVVKREEPKKEVKREEQKQDVPPEKTNENTEQGQDGFIYHQVQPGETLFRIAMNYYKSQQGVDKIKQANGLASNEISAGQTLKIPRP